MKVKLLLVLLVALTGCVYAQTWTRHLAWEDLVPAWEDHPVAEAYNVIPAIGGGYLMQGVLTIHEYDDYYINVFWKVSNSGEVLWRRDFYAPQDRITCLVSNGVDRYYALSPDYHSNILFEYDTQMNPIRSITIDSLFTNGEQIGVYNILIVNDGILLSGRNIMNAFIMKMSFELELMWSHTFTSMDSNGLAKLYRTHDGGIITYGGFDLLRMNSSGDTLWVFEASPPVTNLLGMVCNSDGTYAVRGLSNSQPYIFTFDDNGNYLEGNSFNIPGLSLQGSSFIGTPDDQLMIFEARFSSYATPLVDYGLMHKISHSGELLWSNLYYQLPRFHDAGRGSQPIFVDDQGFYILCLDEAILIKADGNGNATENLDPLNGSNGTILVLTYPNPVSHKICFNLANLPKGDNLTFSIFNIRGQRVHECKVDYESKLVEWEVPSKMENGIYLFKLWSNKRQIAAGKFSVIR